MTGRKRGGKEAFRGEQKPAEALFVSTVGKQEKKQIIK